MAIEDWERFDNGDIVTHPLVGLEMLPAAGMSILMRMQYLRAEDQFEKPSGHVQLILTPSQAVELSQMLQTMAARLMGHRPSGPAS